MTKLSDGTGHLRLQRLRLLFPFMVIGLIS
jgi:hypothetical protein